MFALFVLSEILAMHILVHTLALFGMAEWIVIIHMTWSEQLTMYGILIALCSFCGLILPIDVRYAICTCFTAFLCVLIGITGGICGTGIALAMLSFLAAVYAMHESDASAKKVAYASALALLICGLFAGLSPSPMSESQPQESGNELYADCPDAWWLISVSDYKLENGEYVAVFVEDSETLIRATLDKATKSAQVWLRKKKAEEPRVIEESLDISLWYVPPEVAAKKADYRWAVDHVHSKKDWIKHMKKHGFL